MLHCDRRDSFKVPDSVTFMLEDATKVIERYIVNRNFIVEDCFSTTNNIKFAAYGIKSERCRVQILQMDGDKFLYP